MSSFDDVEMSDLTAYVDLGEFEPPICNFPQVVLDGRFTYEDLVMLVKVTGDALAAAAKGSLNAK